MFRVSLPWLLNKEQRGLKKKLKMLASAFLTAVAVRNLFTNSRQPRGKGTPANGRRGAGATTGTISRLASCGGEGKSFGSSSLSRKALKSSELPRLPRRSRRNRFVTVANFSPSPTTHGSTSSSTAVDVVATSALMGHTSRSAASTSFRRWKAHHGMIFQLRRRASTTSSCRR